jgi:alpha-aminoadipate carrier protein LysW
MEAVCPECGETLEIPDDVEEGEIIDCDNCGVELDVESVEPLRLTVFEEEEK